MYNLFIISILLTYYFVIQLCYKLRDSEISLFSAIYSRRPEAPLYTTNTVHIKYYIYASNQAPFQLSERDCDLWPGGECRAVRRGHTWRPCGPRSVRWCLSPAHPPRSATEPPHTPHDRWQSAKNNNTSYNVLLMTIGSLPGTTTPVSMDVGYFHNTQAYVFSI